MRVMQKIMRPSLISQALRRVLTQLAQAASTPNEYAELEE